MPVVDTPPSTLPRRKLLDLAARGLLLAAWHVSCAPAPSNVQPSHEREIALDLAEPAERLLNGTVTALDRNLLEAHAYMPSEIGSSGRVMRGKKNPLRYTVHGSGRITAYEVGPSEETRWVDCRDIGDCKTGIGDASYVREVVLKTPHYRSTLEHDDTP